jgi:4-amino-4-deoxy-L-arabinose transferase-like glycosyltransferase
VLPWFLPRELSSLLFVALVVGSLFVAAWSEPEGVRAFLQFIVASSQRTARLIVLPFVHAYALVIAYRAALSIGFAWGAVALMIYSAFLFLPEHGIDIQDEAAKYALLGGLALAASLLLAPRRLTLPAVSDSPAHYHLARKHLVIALLGVLALALSTEISSNLLNTDLLRSYSHRAQLLILCAGLALLTWGLAGSRIFPPLSIIWRGSRGVRLNELALVCAITLLAFILRWWQLGEAVHFFVDEVNFVTAVLEFRTTNTVPLLAPFSSITAFPWLYPYLQSETVNLFGRDLVGLRAVSAFMGTLTIPALYLLAKALFDRKTALLAALLLATFPPHIHFSRLGINNIADPLFGVLALAFLARGLTANRRMDYVIGGVSLGLTQYFYEGGRLLYPPLVVLWLGLGLLLWPRARQTLSLHWRGLALAGLAALLVALPIYLTLWSRNDAMAMRMNEAGLNDAYWQNLFVSGDANTMAEHLYRIRSSFAIYVNLPESSLFYGGGQPLLLGYLVAPLLLGLFYAAWRLRSPGTLLVVLWLLLASFGNSLLVTSTHSPRYVVVFPALALLVAVGVRYILPLTGLNRLPRKPRFALVGALVATFAVGQIAYYFGPHLDRFRYDFWFNRASPDGQDVAFRSAGFPMGTQVHVITQQPYMTLPEDGAILNFLSDGVLIEHYLSREINPETLRRLPLYTDHAFFIEPDDMNTLFLLRQFFRLDGPQFSPWNVPMGRQFIMYYARQWRQPRR